ncbi:hypothetical protein EDD55_102408 [Varunaivibrio sulfuroxidans]|uniref:Uncharacterized protein n=1 Tax=Varunaivibrio sulfuroxidans TaxID=1773489 RepID=A0A4R3JGD9_9PROT|nr:hypothetical protein EDD55_102408 [Varunaivibrio sulfuroxidans]
MTEITKLFLDQPLRGKSDLRFKSTNRLKLLDDVFDGADDHCFIICKNALRKPVRTRPVRLSHKCDPGNFSGYFRVLSFKSFWVQEDGRHLPGYGAIIRAECQHDVNKPLEHKSCIYLLFFLSVPFALPLLFTDWNCRRCVDNNCSKGSRACCENARDKGLKPRNYLGALGVRVKKHQANSGYKAKGGKHHKSGHMLFYVFFHEQHPIVVFSGRAV